ncbi:MAG: V-type ATP synthase subunit E [Eubacteriaceae bacterium]|jgi:V/A-type H+-transporting ATPase subunit E|nr:V-type ATP synthase subunit E [Eubacteriaceae bacterium]
MADLDGLVSRIKREGQERAEAIKAKAHSDAEKILSDMAVSVEAQKSNALAAAERQAGQAGERILEDEKQKARNMVLSAKQETIDKAYQAALQRLNAMSKERFMDYAKEAVSSFSPDGGEIILPKRYEFADIGWLNDHLRQKGQKGNLALYSGERDISGGFVLVKGGIERNNTFEALLEYYRFETEGTVLEILFGKGAPS